MAEFETKCPHCQSILSVQDDWIGMEVECPTCKQTFTVPENVTKDQDVSDPQNTQAETSPASSGSAETTFIFVCPDCGTQVELPSVFKGKEFECKVCCETSIAQPATEKKCPHCGAVIKFNVTRCKYCKKDVNDTSIGKIMGKSKKLEASSQASVKEKFAKEIKPRKNLRKILFIFSCIFLLLSCAVFVKAIFSPRPYLKAHSADGQSAESVSTSRYSSISVGESSYGTYLNAKRIADNTSYMLTLSSLFQKSLSSYCEVDQERKTLFNIGFGLQGIAFFLLLVSIFINQIWEYEKKQ